MNLTENSEKLIETLENYEEKPEFAIDISNLPKQEHNWVKRGIKVSCEGAGHPHHSHFLVKK